MKIFNFFFKFYGVTYGNKVSHVNTITKAEALDFVSDDIIQQWAICLSLSTFSPKTQFSLNNKTEHIYYCQS